MPRREFQSFDELMPLVGTEVAVSDWVDITQERIDKFAEATGDHQWIHVDVERAKRESPYGTPIAHGFLTLSLLAKFSQDTFAFPNSRMGVNYGTNRVRFTDAVPVGSRLRARFVLGKVERIDRGVQMVWEVTMEREGAAKPAMVAETITRRYD